MRSISVALIIFGIIYSGLNLRDEIRGQTTITDPSGASSASWYPHHASKENEASNFRGAMIYQWLMSLMTAGAGCYGIYLCSRADKTDPFSTNLQWPKEE